MNSLNDDSFHDAEIIEDNYNKLQHSVELIINYPTDWNNNIFEKKALVFYKVTRYTVSEISSTGTSVILNITVISNPINKTAYIETNMGNREIDFQYTELQSCIL